jgi:hypothetical protein
LSFQRPSRLAWEGSPPRSAGRAARRLPERAAEYSAPGGLPKEPRQRVRSRCTKPAISSFDAPGLRPCCLLRVHKGSSVSPLKRTFTFIAHSSFKTRPQFSAQNADFPTSLNTYHHGRTPSVRTNYLPPSLHRTNNPVQEYEPASLS